MTAASKNHVHTFSSFSGRVGGRGRRKAVTSRVLTQVEYIQHVRWDGSEPDPRHSLKPKKKE